MQAISKVFWMCDVYSWNCVQMQLRKWVRVDAKKSGKPTEEKILLKSEEKSGQQSKSDLATAAAAVNAILHEHNIHIDPKSKMYICAQTLCVSLNACVRFGRYFSLH